MDKKPLEFTFRHVYMGLGGLLVILVMTFTDPSSGWIQQLPIGASTVSLLVILLQSVLYVGLLHLSRKAFFDYFDLGDVIKKAMETSQGAGSVVIGVGVFTLAISIVIFAATR